MDERKAGSGSWGRREILFGLLAAGGLATLLAAQPIAASAFGGGGFRGMCSRRAPLRMSPGAMQEHLEVGVKWALRDVDATLEQRSHVASIVRAAMTDLHGLGERHAANREALRAQLGAETVDREALERIRQAELALADEASRRLVQAAADAADVLTPEQRKALAERHRHRR